MATGRSDTGWLMEWLRSSNRSPQSAKGIVCILQHKEDKMAKASSKKVDEKETKAAPGANVETPEEKPGPGEGRPDIPKEVLHDVKRRLDVLVQKRDTASNSLQRALQTAESAKTQALVLRGRLSVYDEQIADIEKKYGVKVPVH